MKIRTQEIAELTTNEADTLTTAIATLEMIADTAEANGELRKEALKVMDALDSFAYIYTDLIDEEEEKC